MTREQYMALLEQGLEKLSSEERDNALEFYEEYFDEAGDDDAVMTQLGSPAKLAAQIVADAFARSMGEDKSVERTPEPSDRDAAQGREPQPEYGAEAFQSGANSAGPRPQYADETGSSGQYGQGRTAPIYSSTPPVYAAPYPTQSTKRKGVSAVWVIILGILALPVGLPLLAVAFALVVAILAVCFGLIAALIGVLIAIVVVPIRAIVFGLTSAAGAVFSTGLMLGGVLSALGVLLIFGPLTVWLIMWIYRGACRAVAWIYNKLRGGSTR